MGDTMDIRSAFKNYTFDDEFKINIIKNKINIIKYTTVGHFDSEKVIINHSDGKVIIKGKNLVVSKLLNDEILITGKINIVELEG
jgi:YabP family.